MAIATLNIFNTTLRECLGKELETSVEQALFRAFHPDMIQSRSVGRTALLRMTILELQPSDVALTVPEICPGSQSDVDFTIEVPAYRANLRYPAELVRTRVAKISSWLILGFSEYSHRIIEDRYEGAIEVAYRPPSEK